MTTLLHVSLFLKHHDCVLLVQEADPEDGGRWNLPGGHVEPGETITDGAVREALEETGLRITLTHLLGVYAGPGTLEKRAVRFVFHADFTNGEAIAGDGVLSVRWLSVTELAALPDERLLSGASLRRILNNGFSGVSYPLSVLRE